VIPLAEAQLLVAAGTGAEVDFARVAVLDAYLADRARRTPHACALQWDDRQWDCATLDRAAEGIAHRLASEWNVGRGDVVAVWASRSPELVAAIFGILKCGAAYLPLDLKCPVPRLEYILRDSGCALLLTDVAHAGATFGVSLRVVDLASMAGPVAHPVSPPMRSGDDPAYLLYTSGTTGLPKGILVEHRSAVNLLEHLQRTYPVGPRDRYLFKTAYTFDVSVPEIFGWAAGEGALVLMPEGAESEPAAILDVVRRHHVTHVNFVPAMWRAVLEHIAEDATGRWPTWRHVMVAGEAFTEEAARLLLQWNRVAAVENLYGPTEASVYVTGFNLGAWNGRGRVPIGRPVANTHARVVDAAGLPCGVGSAGELVISGVQLARGYVRKPA
jgi:amino acid adenylation domain-containing protein